MSLASSSQVFESPPRTNRSSAGQNAHNPALQLSSTKRFFEELKVKLFPYEQAWLLPQGQHGNDGGSTWRSQSSSPTKPPVNPLSESVGSQFQQPASREIENILRALGGLECSSHSIRQYDHICSLDTCSASQTLYCSQCLLEDEKHSKDHKTSFKPLESFLTERMDSLSGEAACKRVRLLMRSILQLKDTMDATELEVCEKIDADMHTIESSVRTLCAMIRENLIAKVKASAAERTASLKTLLVELQEEEANLWKEQEATLQDFKVMLPANLNLADTVQLNNFAKKLKGKAHKFRAESFLKLADDRFFELKSAESHAKTDAYNRNFVKDLSKQVSQLIEIPFAQGVLFSKDAESAAKARSNFSNAASATLAGAAAANSTNRSAGGLSVNGCTIGAAELTMNASVFASSLTQQQLCDQKKILLDYRVLYEGNNGIKERAVKYSLSSESNGMSTHRMAINSIAVMDQHTFACVSNDCKLKVWGVTPTNLVLHEKNSIEFKDICLCVRYSESESALLCAMSNAVVEMYRVANAGASLELVRVFTGHDRTVRSIILTPRGWNDLPGFFTISYDESLKLWSYNDEQAKLTLHYGSDVRVADANSKYVALGCCRDSALLIAEFEEIDNQNSEEGTGKVLTMKRSVKNASCLAQITAVSFFEKNQDWVLCGAHIGMVTLIDVKQAVILKKFDVHKNRVFALNPIEIVDIALAAGSNSESSVLAFVSTSWDGKICVVDVQSGAVVSNATYKLNNDKKKHWNSDGTKLALIASVLPKKDKQDLELGGHQEFRLFSIGNDDRNISTFKLTLTHA